MVRTGITVLVVAALSILADRFISTPTAFVVALLGGLWLLVTWEFVRSRFDSASRSILTVGARHPVLSLTVVVIVGALLGSSLFAGAWIYSVRRFRLEADKPEKAEPASITRQTVETTQPPTQPAQAKPTPSDQEVRRRRDVLERLRQEYILSHDNISPGLLAGTEQPPTAWVNTRLAETGERWRIESSQASQPLSDLIPKIAEDVDTIKQQVTRSKWGLTPAQLRLLTQRESPYKGRAGDNLITCVLGDSDSTRFAIDLVSAFRKAGWTLPGSGYSQAVFSGRPLGIILQIASRDANVSGLSEFVITLREAGIEPVGEIVPSLKADEFRIIVGRKPD